MVRIDYQLTSAIYITTQLACTYPCRGQVGWVGDESCSPQVRGGTETLHSLRKSSKALGVGVRELVRACRNSVLAKCSSQEFDVASLMSSDLLEAAANPAGETSLAERMSVELAQSFVIERVFKVLQGERVLEDSGVYKYEIKY